MPITFVPPTERKDIIMNNVIFHDTTCWECELISCLNVLRKNDYEDTYLTSNAKIFIFDVSDFLVEYTTPEERKQDLISWETIRKTERTKQVPRFAGEFEYEGKYYAILCADDKFTNETDSILYHGVILDPIAYQKTQQDVSQVWKKTQAKVIDIVP